MPKPTQTKPDSTISAMTGEAGSITTSLDQLFDGGDFNFENFLSKIMELLQKFLGIDISAKETDQPSAPPVSSENTTDAQPAPSDGQTADAELANTKFQSFDDFVQRHHYQYGPHFDAESLQQAPQFAHGEVDHGQAYALAVAKNIGSIEGDSVALNQTVDTAIVAMAEIDPDDPMRGQMHYVAFVQGSNPRTYIFTENIRINPDGSITSEMEQGQGWDMKDLDEQSAYSKLVAKFAEAAAPGQPPSSLMAAFEKHAGGDLAVGGVANRAGEVEITHESDRVAAASASALNETTGVEIESSYGVTGDGEMKLTVFRQNAAGMTMEDSVAPGADNQAKYNAWSKMEPGIKTLAP